MIPPPRPAGLGVVTCSGSGGTGDTWSNIFCINLGTSPDTPEVIAAHFTGLYSDLAIGGAIFPTGWTLTNISLETGPTGGTRRFDIGQNATGGTNAGVPMAPQVAVVASHKTEFTGPSRRGRTYLGPLSNSINAQGLVSAAARNAIVGSFDVLRGDLQAAGRQLVVWSRTKGFITPITATSVGGAFDTQRSRRSSLRG